jgi:hypothetical protein
MNGRRFKKNGTFNRHFLTTILVVALLASVASAMFINPPLVPVNRLIQNTEAFIKEHPADATAQYTLGRIHYLAFALRSRQLRGRLARTASHNSTLRSRCA